jgi:hypothetical protein
MPFAMVPIYTQTVGSTAIGAFTFSNIPSNYTDLLIKFSARENGVTGPFYVGNWFRFNGDSSSSYSNTQIYANGSSASSNRESSQTLVRVATTPTGSTTANTFGNTDVYIPNYTSSTFKQLICDSVSENNNSFSEQFPVAGLWRNSSAINSITIFPQVAFTQHSTFTLYGIKNA